MYISTSVFGYQMQVCPYRTLITKLKCIHISSLVPKRNELVFKERGLYTINC